MRHPPNEKGPAIAGNNDEALIKSVLANTPDDRSEAPSGQCAQCGRSMRWQRASKRYCSPACRQAALRSTDHKGQHDLVDTLKARGFVGKIWPVYSWDDSPAVYGLLVPRKFCIDEINADPDREITDRELIAALRASDIADYTDRREERLIREFHQSRSARRAERREALSVTESGGRDQ